MSTAQHRRVFSRSFGPQTPIGGEHKWTSVYSTTRSLARGAACRALELDAGIPFDLCYAIREDSIERMSYADAAL